ncbi:hypothetical protein ACFSTH_07510 [Paenibacillus yanchengensis]|uniref:Uncharacterized protein n=1 Tax=Paenibacillus yanchengensis TaxID=2035833 RepID=A0ABW4YLV1_9BACL
MEWNAQQTDDRQPYYVSVQAMQILADPKAAPYELEIVASSEEVWQIQQLFAQMVAVDNSSTAFSLVYIFSEHTNSEVVAEQDDVIQRIYRKLYECGTAETKEHIAKMGILH